METEQEVATPDTLLDSALDWEAPLQDPFRWKPNAHRAIVQLMNDTIDLLDEAMEKDDSVASECSFEALCILSLDAVDALLEHPNPADAHVFAETLDQLIVSIREDILALHPGTVDVMGVYSATEELYALIKSLASQLN